jgi:hypothetical protein
MVSLLYIFIFVYKYTESFNAHTIKIPEIEFALPGKYLYMSMTVCKHGKLIETATFQRVFYLLSWSVPGFLLRQTRKIMNSFNHHCNIQILRKITARFPKL